MKGMYTTDKTGDAGSVPDLLSIIDGDIPESSHDNSNEMFHTPNFGEEDFGLSLSSGLSPLSQPAVTAPYTPLPSTLAQGLRQQYSRPVSQFQPNHSMDIPLANSNQGNRTDCSILETLESIAPKFPPQNYFEVPDISVTNSVNSLSVMSTGISTSQMYGRSLLSSVNNNAVQPLTTISQNDISSHLGFQQAQKKVSPIGSTNSTLSPMRESSEDSDDSLPLAQLKKRQVVEEPTPEPAPVAAKKQRTPKKRKKKDPNEPQKPVSAYALFFRDTQVAIKGQNPNASFGEVSKIVASMWEGLDPEHKSVYKKKTEQAKKEYLKQLAAYRASLVSQTGIDEAAVEKSPSPPRQSPPGTSPQHLMPHMGDSPMGFSNSPAHLSSPQHMSSPQHLSSPPHMTSSPPHPGMLGYNNHQRALVEQKMAAYNSMMERQMPPLHNSGMLDQLQPQGNNGRILAPGMCIRNGCTNRAIDNIGWDSEYCSNECVVSHCRDVFTAWVASRQTAVNSFQVK